MDIVLIKAFSFLVIILGTWVLRKKGFFQKNDYQLVSRIVFNITLPAVIISSFEEFKTAEYLFLYIAFGLVFNSIGLFAGWLIGKKKAKSERLFYLLHTSGLNIGCFVVPFVQSFYSPEAIVIVCLLDIGNALMNMGFSYVVVDSVNDEGKNRTSPGDILKRLAGSVPFVTYCVMLLWMLIKIPVPRIVYSVTDLVAGANPFLAMVVLGLVFDLDQIKDKIKKVIPVLIYRYGASSIAAVLIYMYFPLPQMIREIMVFVLFAPIAITAAILTGKYKGDVKLAGFVSSLSILISLFIMVGLAVFFGVS